MTDPSIYQVIEHAFRELDRVVEDESPENDAAEILQHLTKDGGGIHVPEIDEFYPRYEHVKAVQERVEGEYAYAYGLDGSTTKSLSFNNGLVVSAGVAAAGVTERNTIDSISTRSTISIVTYFDDYDIDIDVETQNKDIKLEINQFPRLTNMNSELPNWISSIARTYAEGLHFEWLAEDADQPVFVDGPLLPVDVLIWALYDQQGSQSGTPIEDWPEMIHGILQAYINGIESCIRTQTPVFGVQKSTVATRVIDALKEKEPELDGNIPWTNDTKLFDAALRPDDQSLISYTPWYREEEFQVGRNKNRIVPLKDYDGVTFKYGSAEDYVRELFFVKPPTQDTVFRIGVPAMLFDQNIIDRTTARDIALAEMVKTYKEPLPIVIADEKVRIPRELRNEFRSLFTESSHEGYNEQREFDRFGDNND